MPVTADDFQLRILEEFEAVKMELAVAREQRLALDRRLESIEANQKLANGSLQGVFSLLGIRSRLENDATELDRRRDTDPAPAEGDTQ